MGNLYDIDDDLYILLLNLNVYCIAYKMNNNINDINTTKMIMIDDIYNVSSKRLLINYYEDYEMPIYMNNNNVEHLIIMLEINYIPNLILKNMPNLKILTLYLYFTNDVFIKDNNDMIYEYKIIAKNLPNLKVIFYDNKKFYININIPNIPTYNFTFL